MRKYGKRLHGMSLADRLAFRTVDGPGGCRLWTGATTSWGYGHISDENRRMRMCHRVSWELAHGPIPKGLFVCHKCDVRACINPDHLFLGTHDDNMRDMFAKGRNNNSGRPKGTDHFRAKITPEIVRRIRRDARSVNEQAQEYGISRHTVWDVKKGRRWAHVEDEPSRHGVPIGKIL